MVFALRLSESGAYSVRVTAPPGVTASIGSDVLGRSCANDSPLRRCLGTATQQTETGVGVFGDRYFYVATSQPATLVIDAELP